MIERLQTIENKYNHITKELMSDEVIGDVKKTMELSKEQALLKEPYDAYQQYKRITNDIVSANEMLEDKELVEFAKEEHEKHGLSVREAAVKAAKLRFRAIMMTELAFIIGVLPMIFASGAGANSRISVGSTVFGGMIAAATLGSALTPAFYVIVQEFVDKFPKREITEKDLEI